MSGNLLSVLKQSDTGLTREQLLAKCQENEITDPLPQAQNLVLSGLVRIDKEPKPMRIKATKKAFEE